MAHLREFLRDYDNLVSELRDFPDKETIAVATDIAGENIKHAQHVAGFLASKMARAPHSYKLPLLYLIDSIVKRVGRSYVSEFSPLVRDFFPEQYVLVSARDQGKFKHVLDTWEREQTFAPYLVAHLRRALDDADARLRAQQAWYSAPPPPAGRSHEYPTKRQRLGYDGGYNQSGGGGYSQAPPPYSYAPVPAPAPAPYGYPPASTGYYAPTTDPRDVQPPSLERWGNPSVVGGRDPRGSRPMPPRAAVPPLAPGAAGARLLHRRPKRGRRSRSRSRSQSPPRRPRSPLAGRSAPMDLSDLSGDASAVAKALYHNGPRCDQCGARFKTQDEKASHLSWHFERTHAERTGSSMSARWWYATTEEWVVGGAAARSKNIKVADLFGDTVANDDAAEPTPEDSKVPVEDGVTTCDVCGDDLRKQYNGESGEFEFVNAVKVGGRIIHATCQS